MNCMYCKSVCIRKGGQKNGSQKFLCENKECCKYQQNEYSYNAYIKKTLQKSTQSVGVKNLPAKELETLNKFSLIG